LMAGDASSQITYQWSQCNNAFYTPIQFMDNLFPITAVAWATSSTGPFTALALDPNKGGNNYWANGGENLNSTTGPFYFNITDGRGQSVTLGPISNTSCGVNATTGQLPGCGPTNTPAPTNTFTKTPTAGTLPGGITATNCAPGGQAAGAQQQQVVLSGPGLNYVMASENCNGA